MKTNFYEAIDYLRQVRHQVRGLVYAQVGDPIWVRITDNFRSRVEGQVRSQGWGPVVRQIGEVKSGNEFL